MKRRSLLRKTPHALLTVFGARAAPGLLFGPILTAARPHTLEEAVRTGDPAEVQAYIVARPALSRHSPLSVRLHALEILEGDARQLLIAGIESREPSLLAPRPAVSPATCLGYQEAGASLLAGSSDTDLAWIALKMGGVEMVEARLARFAHPELTATMQRAVTLLQVAAVRADRS